MNAVIVGGARTPTGKFLGLLADLPATELGACAISGALVSAGVAADAVESVVMGQVLSAGAGQLPARQAAVAAGIGFEVPALTINKVCLSGLAAVALAAGMVRAGDCDVVVAGGMESMSQAPHLLPRSRRGFRYGEVTLLDHLAYDGLRDAYTDQAMGALAESQNCGGNEVSRADQDAFAARSHQQAARAASDGTFAKEIVAVTVPQRRGESVVVEVDEGVRHDTSVETLAGLKPAFGQQGTISAGSASPLSDGAAALVVASEAAVERLGLTPLARVGAYGQVAGPDSSLQCQPANAVRAVCRKQGLSVDELDLIEINEAFAAVVLASARALGLDQQAVEQRVNVDGGAIALGHPLGASGARLVLHLALALQRRGATTGVAALCGGGGQGDALVLTAP